MCLRHVPAGLRLNYLVSPSSTWDAASCSADYGIAAIAVVDFLWLLSQQHVASFQGKVYRMNFHGRVHASSSKNFQLVQATVSILHPKL